MEKMERELKEEEEKMEEEDKKSRTNEEEAEGKKEANCFLLICCLVTGYHELNTMTFVISYCIITKNKRPWTYRRILFWGIQIEK